MIYSNDIIAKKTVDYVLKLLILPLLSIADEQSLWNLIAPTSPLLLSRGHLLCDIELTHLPIAV